jgi:UDP-N-acetylmuramoylalanine--D-glutamate ligase
MGGVGSEALGAAVAGLAILGGVVWWLPLVALLPVLEVVSVIVQVLYFRATGGKRLLRMAPFHHHLELSGWPETRVVLRFWLVTAVLVGLALRLRGGFGGVTAPAPLLVYGLGRSGGAVVARARRAARRSSSTRRAEGDDVAAALAAAPSACRRREALRRDPAPRTCVAAPGVPSTTPTSSAARRRRRDDRRGRLGAARSTPARCVGVTGTAGKGTVTRWITDGLLAAGVDAVAGGNIVPALAAVARPEATLVIELSSFQLERAPGLRPDVAVVLNLGVDHLDRHGDVAAYHEAKRALLRELGPEQTFVGNADDPRVAAWLDASPARVRRFSLAAPTDASWERAAGQLWLDGAPLVAVGDLRVVGEHQVANALATALALDALGVPRETIARALAAFAGLPGRYAEVGRLAGVRFIEDSIATRPLAVEAALRPRRPGRWCGSPAASTRAPTSTRSDRSCATASP